MSAGLVNYLLYEAGWFACILGAAWEHVAVGTVLGALAIAAHLGLARRRGDALVLVLWTAAIGVVVDTTQIALGTLRFDAGSVVAGLPLLFLERLPPLWLVLIWAQFAMTFHFGLRRLRDRPVAAVLFGAVGGPLAFLAGRRLGVVELHPALWPSLLSLALTWSIAMPAALWLAVRQRDRPGIAAYRGISARSA